MGGRQAESFWQRNISPWCVHAVCGMRPFTEQRKKLVPRAHGVVVEIGIGSGLNLPYYDPGRVKKLIGIDPGASLLHLAQKNIEHARAASLDVELVCDTAERMPFEDGFADTVLVTYSFCTIPDARSAMAEARRILKPSGRLLFCEHGRSNNARTAKWQDRLNPAWRAVAGGCNINRDMAKTVTGAGFALEELKNFKLRLTPAVLGYHYVGAARPR